MTFHKFTRMHIEKRLLSVWKYKILKYTVTFFLAERVKEKLYPLQPINFCSEFSSTLLVPFAVLGTPTEGYQKSGMVGYDSLFGNIYNFWQ